MNHHLLSVLTILLSLAQFTFAQQPERGTPVRSAPAELFSNLSTPLSEHASVKIGLIKTAFTKDDLIKLDVAILLRNNVAYFFPPRFRYHILVKDSKGNKVRIKPFMVVESRPTYEKSLGTMYMDSTYLVVGCGGYARANMLAFEAVDDLDSPEELFNGGIFGEPVDGCLDVSKTEPLWISVEVYNSRVVVDEAPVPTRTLVGSIHSPTVKIQIVK